MGANNIAIPENASIFKLKRYVEMIWRLSYARR